MRMIVGWLLFALAGTAACSVVPPDITKTVVFIYKDAAGTPAQADGTGFLISIPSPVDPNRMWVYLVTAKHVVHTDSNDFNSPLFGQLWFRVNKKDGGSSMHKLDITSSGDKQDVFFHSDLSVDIAVLTISLDDIDKLDMKVLPEQMLISADDFKKLNIGVGTDMFFTGMFTGFLGEKKSYPIVRFGKLAMIPEEKITSGGQAAEGYLMEAFSFGGNSGSPVFFYPSADNTPGVMMVGPGRLKIAGVMKGFFEDFEQIRLLENPAAAGGGQPIPVSNGNTGIALIVPAKFISEILHSDALENLRKKNP
ncbi:MAG: hypothetical protein ABI147_05950 [Acidobacteriaceae bacterium]